MYTRYCRATFAYENVNHSISRLVLEKAKTGLTLIEEPYLVLGADSIVVIVDQLLEKAARYQ